MRSLWEWLWPIALGVAIALFIIKFIASVAIVPTASMDPTIPSPCYIIVDHVTTRFAPIHEGEVVLFHFPDNPNKIFVKRVIGLPGDTIEIQGGHVYRDGKILKEPYLHNIVTEGTYGPYLVPAGSYFMLGDNRNISDDSRLWIHKYVARTAIVGQADYVIWPFSKANSIQ